MRDVHFEAVMASIREEAKSRLPGDPGMPYTDSQRQYLFSRASECTRTADRHEADGNAEQARHWRRVAANLLADAI